MNSWRVHNHSRKLCVYISTGPAAEHTSGVRCYLCTTEHQPPDDGLLESSQARELEVEGTKIRGGHDHYVVATASDGAKYTGKEAFVAVGAAPRKDEVYRVLVALFPSMNINSALLKSLREHHNQRENQSRDASWSEGGRKWKMDKRDNSESIPDISGYAS